MPLDEPSWWYADARGDWRTRALRPLGRLYEALTERRFRNTSPYRSRLPVVCVGNLTAGGTGKTPLSLAIAESLMVAGEAPAFLTRGYRGRIKGPAWVDLEANTAHDVGDEPLLLARSAPTVVARDRKAGAQLIECAARKASVIVMDDGLQNPALVKDLAIAVVDGARGIGNGEIIPAGPLRASLAFQLARIDCIVVSGRAAPTEIKTESIADRLRREFPGPVLSATVAPADGSDWVAGQRFVAYAGIGNPKRFFATLEDLSADVAAAVPFPDHHRFTDKDAERLLALADEKKAALVTTEKDLARLHGSRGRLADLRNRSRAIGIRFDLSDGDQLRLAALIDTLLKTKRG